jgi:hypothetical protein
MKKQFLFYPIIIGTFLGINLGGYADTVTSVRNEIFTEANTGNNLGSVETGRAQGSVRIKTEINGKIVEDIDERIVSHEGEPVRFSRSYSHREENADTRTEVRIELNQERQQTRQDAELEPSQTDRNGTISPETSSQPEGNNLTAAPNAPPPADTVYSSKVEFSLFTFLIKSILHVFTSIFS